jgi:hypothetical protein
MLTLVSQCTTRWLLFHSVPPVDSCFTAYYPLTFVSQCTSRWPGSTLWNKSQQVVHCETRVNGYYNVKQESMVVHCETRVNDIVLPVDSCFTLYYPLTLVSQCTTHWLLFHSVLPVDFCFIVYYPLTLVSQYTTCWLLFHSVLPVYSCFTVYYPGGTLWNKSQRVVNCETRVNV